MDIELPKPIFESKNSLEKCIFDRYSIRNFKYKNIELEKVSQLLWSAQGIKKSNRTVPSAGATYPLEIYVILKNQGFFHYNLKKNTLEMKSENELSEKLSVAALNQEFIYEASMNIIICVDFQRTCSRYGERGIRYVFIEVGHCAQNIHLQAVSLGLGSVPIGAFKDNEVKKILNLSKEIEPIYIISIGYPK